MVGQQSDMVRQQPYEQPLPPLPPPPQSLLRRAHQTPPQHLHSQSLPPMQPLGLPSPCRSASPGFSHHMQHKSQPRHGFPTLSDPQPHVDAIQDAFSSMRHQLSDQDVMIGHLLAALHSTRQFPSSFAPAADPSLQHSPTQHDIKTKAAPCEHCLTNSQPQPLSLPQGGAGKLSEPMAAAACQVAAPCANDCHVSSNACCHLLLPHFSYS